MPDHRWYSGTQSWAYQQWLGVFYDEHTRAPEMLRQYAEEFNAVEVDASFHATPPTTSIARWVRETPEHFRFTLKMPRLITHERRFSGVDSEADVFFERAAALGDRLGVVLTQMPPDLDASYRPALLSFLARRAPRVPIALEFRHVGWFTAETFALLEKLDVAVAAVDAPWIPIAYARRVLERPTADFLYLRLLGTRDETLPFDRLQYDRRVELEAWAEALQRTIVTQRFVFSSNFYEGHAPETARRILAALGEVRQRRLPTTQASLFS